MGRKDFIADFESATKNSVSENVTKIVRGSEDGEFQFTYVSPSGELILVHVLITDISEYPSSSIFQFTDSQNAPEIVHKILDSLSNGPKKSRVQGLIGKTASELNKALATGAQSAPFEIDDDPDIESGEESDDDGFGWQSASQLQTNYQPYPVGEEAALNLQRQIAEDLRAVRFAGYKIGVLSGMHPNSSSSLLSISVRIRKLCLSQEAIETWGLTGDQYLVLLIRYSGPYKTFETIKTQSAGSRELEYRIGVSDCYKPAINEAYAAFSIVSAPENSCQVSGENPASFDKAPRAMFRSIFISSSMNDFMNDKFLSLLKIRNERSMSWDLAVRALNTYQGRLESNMDYEPTVDSEDLNFTKKDLPNLVRADHLAESDKERRSFPLIAMQFVMHYFSRCTEYCLVCHDRIADTFEALKPYVCSKPLCLYQYMSLGFGPSIEHEILTQPCVVDLLISFCYAGAKFQKIREYPIGMNLLVPTTTFEGSMTTALPNRHPNSQVFGQPQTPSDEPINEALSYEVKYDAVRKEVIISNSDSLKIRRGDWLVIIVNGYPPTHHRVIDILYPTLRLSDGIVRWPSTVPTVVPSPAATNAPAADTALNYSAPTFLPQTGSLVPATMTVYDKNFDDLKDHEKAEAIVLLLDTLPTVEAMKSYLESQEQPNSTERTLKHWADRISPSALGLLRWVLASNRSCIMQLGEWDTDGGDQGNASGSRAEQKVANIGDEWVQFRFAQGAPDKEQRFHKALLDNMEKLKQLKKLEYPTLFAWHGSAIQNWHSIIRTGLDFKDTVNGRAFGHGCYHSQDFQISMGYSSHNSYGSTSVWPGSKLKITSVICLNEIVNLPNDYQSRSPHLVVQYVDWIQCRYLFVRSEGNLDNTRTATSLMPSGARSGTKDGFNKHGMMEQDPHYTVRGNHGVALGIPLCAMNSSKVLRPESNDHQERSGKKQKVNVGSLSPDQFDESIASDEEDPEDFVFLYCNHGDHHGAGQSAELDYCVSSDTSMGFTPGSLDRSILLILAPPSYATSRATSALGRELKAISESQKKIPQHILGWYIDTNKTDNLYQWIIELHSFEKNLPLAQDMNAAEISSIVLEFRFGKDYPMSPPFVRVIRPRFLPFMSGGGGHVTAGGALCMELLTNSGWTAASSLESVIMQVRMAISSIDPKPARLESRKRTSQTDYGISEAIDAYLRACRAHGWAIPKDFLELGQN